MEDIAAIATAVGIILTGVGLIFTGMQVRDARRIAQGEFLLRLDELFRTHHAVHVRLRPGGEWTGSEKGPQSPAEWAEVEAYMGLFERINLLIERKIVDKEIIDRLYGYRIRNIVANDAIRQAKLVSARASWRDFVNLCELLDIEI